MAGCRFKLNAVWMLCSIIFSTLASAAAPEKLPASAYLHPQQLVSVAPGRRLNLYCVGKGSPTVLFDSGLGDGTLVWRGIQGEIAKTTRTCSYDRANYFYSDPVPRRATAQAAVDDMLALIDRAQLGDHVILVGHSRGGLNVRLFAYEHPDRLAGLVLIDPTVTEKLTPKTTTDFVRKYENYLTAVQKLHDCQHMAELQQLRIDGPDPLHCMDKVDPSNDPEEQALTRSIRSMETGPVFQGTLYSERQHLYLPVDAEGDSTDGARISATERNLGDLQLVIIAADWLKSPSFKGKPPPGASEYLEWRLQQLRHASQESTRGQLIEMASQHYVQKEHPDVVIDAIQHVLNLARH
jgi:pimeloyl-ACP methyl ester carboxylesterase